MTSTPKFIDANVFIERWANPKARELIDNLDQGEYCTSTLVLTEVYHKLKLKGIKNVFDYVRTIMGALKVYEFYQTDLFNAMKNPIEMNINDKIHIEVMKRNGVSIIISYDRDFDKDKTIKREEL
jgi:predicted nucleic acid-binding protein